MPITISFKRLSNDRVAVHLNDQQVSDFEPAALLVDQPLAPNRPTPADPRAYGQRLWAALGSTILGNEVNKLPDAPDLNSLVVIRTNDPDLAAIPWEYLHDDTDFLMLKKLLVRVVPNAPVPAPPDKSKPWRLVVMGSDPLLQEVRDESGKLQGYAKLPRLQVVQELDTLRNTLHQQKAPMRWHRIAPTATALIDELVPTEPVLFHYTGHGDVADGQPILCFDDGTGCMDPHPVPDLAANLRGLAHLAFLNACRTADSREPGANLALTLVQHGIPVVLGTQYTVLDEAASVFAATFYRQLAHGNHPAQALYSARRQLKNKYRNEPQEWAIPVLYLAEGYDWQTQKPEPGISPASIEAPVPQTEELRSPADIIGRATELMELARAFLFENRRIITIRGTGGIGKTALVHALAKRLRYYFRDGIYALSLWLPGEQQLHAADIRRRLANLLNVQHPAFDDPTAVNEQEQALVRAVRGTSRLLLISDNYETVLWRLGQKEEAPENPPDEDPTTIHDPMDRSIIETKQRRLNLLREQQAHFGPRTDPAITIEIENLERELQQWTDSATTQQDEAIAVQRLVRMLAEAGIHLLFTSRQSPVGLAGETFYPTAERGHQLVGLQSADSAALIRANAGERVPSADFVAQLAEALAHHPLALQLATTRWATSQDDEQTFLDNLQTELCKAHDPAAPMYQQSSVEINVRLSVDALPTQLRERLLALTVIANPIITPLHGAVLWAMYKQNDIGRTYLFDQAHTYLEQLHDTSLLQGQGWDNERNRAQVYTIHPVVASVLTHLAHEQDLSVTRKHYADWVNLVISQAHGEGGISHSTEVAQFTQFYLPDISSALPLLDPEQQGWDAWFASIIFIHFGQPENAQQSIAIAQTVAIETDDTRLLSQCYYQEATLFTTRGNLDHAMELYQQARTIQDTLGDQRGIATTLHNMAIIHRTWGNLNQAMALCQQVRTIQDTLGDQRGIAATLHTLASIHRTWGNLNHAMELYQQSLDIKQNLGDQHGIAATLHTLASIHRTWGNLDHAMELYQQSLDIKQNLGDIHGTAATLHNMAIIQFRQGDPDTAMSNARESLRLLHTMGANPDVTTVAHTIHQMEAALASSPNTRKL